MPLDLVLDFGGRPSGNCVVGRGQGFVGFFQNVVNVPILSRRAVWVVAVGGTAVVVVVAVAVSVGMRVLVAVGELVVVAVPVAV